MYYSTPNEHIHMPGESASPLTGKTQPVAAQNTFVQVRAQEGLHQRGGAGLLRFFPRLCLLSLLHSRQQLTPFTAGQKAAVAHHFKILHRDMADMAPDHHLPGQRLPPVLLRTVAVVVVNHGGTAVVQELQEADCKNDPFSDINNGEKGL